jgi:hypothetical protein
MPEIWDLRMLSVGATGLSFAAAGSMPRRPGTGCWCTPPRPSSPPRWAYSLMDTAILQTSGVDMAIRCSS